MQCGDMAAIGGGPAGQYAGLHHLGRVVGLRLRRCGGEGGGYGGGYGGGEGKGEQCACHARVMREMLLKNNSHSGE
jgi:hypothetical protein